MVVRRAQIPTWLARFTFFPGFAALDTLCFLIGDTTDFSRGISLPVYILGTFLAVPPGRRFPSHRYQRRLSPHVGHGAKMNGFFWKAFAKPLVVEGVVFSGVWRMAAMITDQDTSCFSLSFFCVIISSVLCIHTHPYTRVGVILYNERFGGRIALAYARVHIYSA